MTDKNWQIYDVDRYGATKVTFPFWGVLLFETYHWWSFLIVAVSSRRNPDTASVFGSFSWVGLAIELPVLLLLIALAQREPKAGRVPRKIWALGKYLISTTAILHSLGMLFALYHATIWRPWPERGMVAMLLIQGAVILYVWRSSYAHQLFNEFPVEKTED